MKNFRQVVLAAAALLTASAAASHAAAQAHPIDLGVAYTYERSNILAACSCVSPGGGALQAAFPLTPHLAAIAQFDGAAAGNITQFGYQLTLFTYTAGLRYAPLTRPRLLPFAELELGGAHASGSLAPPANNAFALRTGGGISLRAGHRIRIVPIEADYLLTTFANTASNRQNDLQLSAGILLRLKR